MPDSPHIPTFAVAAFAVAILIVGVLAGASEATAAGNPPPIESDTPFVGDEVPAALDGIVGEAPSDGATGLNAALTGKTDRKGAGLPSYKELLGKGWKGKVAKADAKFAKGLDASEAPVAGTLLRAKAGAKVDEFDRRFKIADQMKGKGGKQTRKLKVSAELDGGCPHPSEFGGFGWNGAARATYEVTTTERVSKRYDVVTAVVIDASFENRPDATDFGTAEEWSKNDYGKIAITRNQVAVDRKTGKRSVIGETERFNSTLDPFYVPEGDFLRFVNSQDDDAPAPPRPLRADVWDDVAEWFMAIPYDALRSRVLEAEKLMLTLNRCVKLDRPAGIPTHLAPGQTVELKGIPKLVDDPGFTPFGILESVGRYPAFWINEQGQGLEPLGNVHHMWNGRNWYRYKAPAQTWPASKPAGIELQMWSAAGRATIDYEFKPESPTVYYEILDASISNHTDASRPHSLCGEVGGAKDYDTTFAATGFSDEDKFTIEDGQIEGQVEGAVNARYHSHSVYGCDTRLSGDDSCETALEDRTKSDSVWVGFSNAASPANVRLDWAMEQPEVGYQDAGNDECNAYVWGILPDHAGTTMVPRSTLQSGEPITLSNSGTAHIDTFSTGNEPASIDHGWQYEITIQAVDENGNPLP